MALNTPNIFSAAIPYTAPDDNVVQLNFMFDETHARKTGTKQRTHYTSAKLGRKKEERDECSSCGHELNAFSHVMCLHKLCINLLVK